MIVSTFSGFHGGHLLFALTVVLILSHMPLRKR